MILAKLSLVLVLTNPSHESRPTCKSITWSVRVEKTGNGEQVDHWKVHQTRINRIIKSNHDPGIKLDRIAIFGLSSRQSVTPEHHTTGRRINQWRRLPVGERRHPACDAVRAVEPSIKLSHGDRYTSGSVAWKRVGAFAWPLTERNGSRQIRRCVSDFMIGGSPTKDYRLAFLRDLE